MISQDHVIKGSCDFLGKVFSLQVTTQPSFGGHRNFDSGDIFFLVGEGQGSTCLCFNPPLLFIFKAHGNSYLHTQHFRI